MHTDSEIPFLSAQDTKKEDITILQLPTADLCSCLFSMRKHVRFEVSALSKPLVAAVKWTHIWTVTSMNTDVSA